VHFEPFYKFERRKRIECGAVGEGGCFATK
jgi:hypothetical protein